MWRHLTLIVVIAALVLSSSTARADYCLNINSGAYIIVGRGFTVPAKGKCKAWVGFSAQSNDNQPSTGTGCTSSDGMTLNFTLITSFAESIGAAFSQDAIVLNLPSQDG